MVIVRVWMTESTNPVIQQRGQTKEWQLNGLQQVQDYLKTSTSLQKKLPWTVKNGSIEGKKTYLKELNDLLESDPQLHDALLSRLQIGVQEDVAVADCLAKATGECLVTQTYNSAISIGYDRRLPAYFWEPMAKIVLQATYEATLLVAILKAIQFDLQENNPKTVTVLLTPVSFKTIILGLLKPSNGPLIKYKSSSQSHMGLY